jgi:nucleoside permease NupC
MTILVSVVGAFIFCLLIYLVSKRIRRLRYKYAFSFGRIEHFAGRLMIVLLVGAWVGFYFSAYGVAKFFVVFAIGDWCVYYFSHRAEKILHGSQRFRKR